MARSDDPLHTLNSFPLIQALFEGFPWFSYNQMIKGKSGEEYV